MTFVNSDLCVKIWRAVMWTRTCWMHFFWTRHVLATDSLCFDTHSPKSCPGTEGWLWRCAPSPTRYAAIQEATPASQTTNANSLSHLHSGDEACERSAKPPGSCLDVGGPPAGHQLRRPRHVWYLGTLIRFLRSLCRIRWDSIQCSHAQTAGYKLYQVSSCVTTVWAGTSLSRLPANVSLPVFQVQFSDPGTEGERPDAVAETVGELCLCFLEGYQRTENCCFIRTYTKHRPQLWTTNSDKLKSLFNQMFPSCGLLWFGKAWSGLPVLSCFCLFANVE